METLLANLTGKTHRAVWQGRNYIVAPLTLIVPGVLNGSKGALYYPSEEIRKDPSVWNHVPIVVYHPTHNGEHVSARDPAVLEKQGIGHVFRANARNKAGKLTAEGWFDEEKTRQVDNRILENLESGKPIELSTGLFTDNDLAENGAHYNGKAYQYTARNYRPDHLAILPDQVGACSLQDGCGVMVNERAKAVVSKYLANANPNHDEKGRFSESDSASAVKSANDTAQKASEAAHDATMKTGAKASIKKNSKDAKWNSDRLSETQGDESRSWTYVGAQGAHQRAMAGHLKAAKESEGAEKESHKAAADLHKQALDAHLKASETSRADQVRFRPNELDKRMAEYHRARAARTPEQIAATEQAIRDQDKKEHAKAAAGIYNAQSRQITDGQFSPTSGAAVKQTSTAATKGFSGEPKSAALVGEPNVPEGDGRGTAKLTKVVKVKDFDGDEDIVEDGENKDYFQESVDLTDKSGSPIKNSSSKQTPIRGAKMTKEQFRAKLTANCKCEEDKAAINQLSDETLNTMYGNLVANEMKAEGSAAGVIGAKGTDDQAGGEEDDPDSMTTPGTEVAVKAKKVAPAGNSRLTLAQWESSMPEEAKAIWNAAKDIERKERASIVQHLVSNVADEKQRKLIGNQLFKKTVDELRLLSTLIPTQSQRVANFQADQEESYTNYLGAIGGPINNQGPIDNAADDILEDPVLNFQEIKDWQKKQVG